MSDSLQELLHSKSGGARGEEIGVGEVGGEQAGGEEKREKRKEKCWRYKNGDCFHSDKCKFIHPKSKCMSFEKNGNCGKLNCLEVHDKRKDDCKYWMDGFCNRQGMMECRNKHEKEKKGLNKKKPFLEEHHVETIIEKVKNQMDQTSQFRGQQLNNSGVWLSHPGGQDQWRGGQVQGAQVQGASQGQEANQSILQQEIRKCLVSLLQGGQ